MSQKNIAATSPEPTIQHRALLHAYAAVSPATIAKWYRGERIQPLIAERLALVAKERGIPLPAPMPRAA